METTTTARPAYESNIRLDACKSYATEANLRTAIAKLAPVSYHRPLQYVVTRTPNGRWTAIFWGDGQSMIGTGFPTILF